MTDSIPLPPSDLPGLLGWWAEHCLGSKLVRVRIQIEAENGFKVSADNSQGEDAENTDDEFEVIDSKDLSEKQQEVLKSIEDILAKRKLPRNSWLKKEEIADWMHLDPDGGYFRTMMRNLARTQFLQSSKKLGYRFRSEN